jgi:hypothetical protein
MIDQRAEESYPPAIVNHRAMIDDHAYLGAILRHFGWLAGLIGAGLASVAGLTTALILPFLRGALLLPSGPSGYRA